MSCHETQVSGILKSVVLHNDFNTKKIYVRAYNMSIDVDNF